MDPENKRTSLLLAINEGDEDLGLHLLKEDPLESLSCDDHHHGHDGDDHNNNNPFLLAMYKECYKLAKEILTTIAKHRTLMWLIGITDDEADPSNYLYNMLLYPETFIEAAEADLPLLLQRHSTEDGSPWYEACRASMAELLEQTFNWENWAPMPPGFMQAATTGDSDWLKNNVKSKPHTYWLCRASPSDDNPYAGNILHLAIQSDEKLFAVKVMRELPPEVAHLLSRQQETGGGLSDWNPLHFIVDRGDIDLVQEILKCDNKVRRSKGLDWLHFCPDVATDNQRRTPALLAIQKARRVEGSYDIESCASADLLTSDNRAPLIQNIDDYQHNSPLFLAVQNGLHNVVTNLLRHCVNPLHTGPDGLTALHIILRLDYISLGDERKGEEVAKELFARLEKYISTCDDNGFTVLHKWVEQMDFDQRNSVGTWMACDIKEKWRFFEWFFESYPEKAVHLMSLGDTKHGNNPLHHLVNLTSDKSAEWTAEQLLKSYKTNAYKICSQSEEEVPLLMENKHGCTPLVWAIQKKKQYLALTFLKEYPVDALCAVDDQKKNPFLHAAYHEFYDVGKEILNKTKNHYGLINLLPFDAQPPESILRYAADFPVMFMGIGVTPRLRARKESLNWDPATLGSWEEYKVFNTKIWPEMDPEVKNAACSGAVQLFEDVKTKPFCYLLCRSSTITDDPEGVYGGNILHLAVWHRKRDFVHRALTLGDELRNLLLLQKETVGVLKGWNPLHLAVHRNDVDLVDMIISCRPHRDAFTAQDSLGRTPALLAIELGHQQCAEILTRERIYFEYWSNADLIQEFQGIPDEQGNSLLYLAVRKGFDKVAINLLNCRGSLSCSGPNGSTVLHVMTGILHDWGKQGTTTGSKLFKRFKDLMGNVDNEGLTVLHKWVKMEDAWFSSPKLQERLISLLKHFFNTYPEVAVELMFKTDLKNDNSPLHVLATNSISLDSASSNVVRKILRLYKDSVDKVIEKEPSKANNLSLNLEPLLSKRNKARKTPLLVAIDNKLQDLAWYFFEECSVDSLKSLRCDENPLKLALDNECYQLVKNMLGVLDVKDLTSLLKFGVGGSNVLHYASTIGYPEWIVKEVVEKFPDLCNERDTTNDETPLDKAAAAGKLWLVQLILRNNRDALSKARHAWQRACEEGHELVLKCFMKECPSFRGICLGSRDTPLHHMKQDKWNYAKYTELLDHKVFAEFINEQDNELWETPLHRAIRVGDKDLAEALFKMDDIDLHIKDKANQTAMDLLQRYKDDKDWIAMCERVGIDPTLKTTYVQRRKDLLNIRDTLLVVAALLGAITFQAGFTLPGGLDQNTGEALRVKKPAFLAFLIADVYAFCCSMLVIFCLVWSMFSDSSKTILWIDYSMSILLHALYASLVAFMTGVYTVISPKASWAAIVTIVMCSVIGISSFEGSILYREITVLKLAWKKFIEMLRCCGCCFKGDTSRSANMNSTTNTNVTTININP